MQRAIELSKKITAHIDEDCYAYLVEVNLHKIFEPISTLKFSNNVCNSIISFILYAYDNDSSWLNFKQDRYENKLRIFKSLTDKYNDELFLEIISNNNSLVNEVIGEYLLEQTTWKWRHIMTLLDYHSNMIRFATQKTEEEKTYEKMNKEGEVKSITQEYDIDKISKVNKQKGELLEQALKARREADTLLSEIKKEFVQLNHVVQSDFGFEITEEKTIDPLSWREFIKKRNASKA